MESRDGDCGCAGLVLSLVAVPRLSVGLDQAVALPSDSYLQQYFRSVQRRYSSTCVWHGVAGRL